MTPVALFVTSFITGLSGAMMPGPLLAVTITETMRRGFGASFFISCGHSLLELITVAIIALGLGALLNDRILTGLIGITGGVVMAWMSVGMLKEAKTQKVEFASIIIAAFGIVTSLYGKAILGFTIAGFGLISWIFVQYINRSNSNSDSESLRSFSNASISKWRLHPFNLGIVISLSNPYWTLWWLTIGSNLVLSSLRSGSANLPAVYLGHILSDYSWYCAVGALISLGKRTFSAKLYHGLLEACSAFMIALSFHFFLTGLVKFV